MQEVSMDIAMAMSTVLFGLFVGSSAYFFTRWPAKTGRHAPGALGFLSSLPLRFALVPSKSGRSGDFT
jgi:hypothetical protein